MLILNNSHHRDDAIWFFTWSHLGIKWSNLIFIFDIIVWAATKQSRWRGSYNLCWIKIHCLSDWLSPHLVIYLINLGELNKRKNVWKSEGRNIKKEIVWNVNVWTASVLFAIGSYILIIFTGSKRYWTPPCIIFIFHAECFRGAPSYKFEHCGVYLESDFHEKRRKYSENKWFICRLCDQFYYLPFRPSIFLLSCLFFVILLH